MQRSKCSAGNRTTTHNINCVHAGVRWWEIKPGEVKADEIKCNPKGECNIKKLIEQHRQQHQEVMWNASTGHCGQTQYEVIILVSRGELRATPSAPALGEGNV